FALIAGAGEAGGLAVRKLVRNNPIRTTPHAAWMAPIGDAMLFAIPLVLLFLFAQVVRRPIGLRAVVLLLAFLAFLSVLLVPSWIRWYAELSLAGGLAVVSSHFAATHADAFLR